MNRPTSTLPGFRGIAQQLCSLVAIASLAAACVKRLPPAPMPPPVAPPVAPGTPPPAEQHGRLIVDVVEGPTPVQRVHVESRQQVDQQGGRVSYRFLERPALLCAATPCVADAPAGSNILVGFPVIGDDQALEVELVHVGPATSVYRRSLSVYDDRARGTRVLGIVGATFGGMAAATGATLLPIGLAKDRDGMTTAGGITLGVGVVLLAAGIWAIRRGAPIVRPGAANHFPASP